MNTIEIGGGKYEIEFAPDSIESEIVQNVRIILNSLEYSTHYNLGLGLSGSYVDEPINRVQAMMRADITKQIKEFEPRAKVSFIEFRIDPENGKTVPVLGVTIDD